MPIGRDPEVRQLAIATARAFAVAEQLVIELERTLTDLSKHVQPQDTSDTEEQRHD